VARRAPRRRRRLRPPAVPSTVNAAPGDQAARPAPASYRDP
jgi:hypothetical protein